MKNRLILSFTFLFFAFSLYAQDFEIVNVESLPADMSAREEMKTDHNDRQCALLRIATQNIAPEQREGFVFEPDLGSEVVERITRDGEILLWVSPDIKYLKIKHRILGRYELYMPKYGLRVESLQTYKITMKGSLPVSSQEQNREIFTQQYLVFQLTPKDAALEVNGQLWPVSADGTARKFVDFGEYNYQVQAPNYYPETGMVTVNDPNNKKNVNVNLKPNYGWIEVKGSDIQGASVYVDNAFIGKVPCKSKELKSGEHIVKIAMELYEPYSERVTVRDGETRTLTPILTADFSTVTLKVETDAEIWVNDEKKGVHSWTGKLASGTYRIECKLSNHESTVTTKEITKGMNGQTITLSPPTPIYGSLNIESTPDFANIYVDGNLVGDTPKYIPKILVGKHEIRIVKENYSDYTETIVISKDERTQLKIVLNNGHKVQFNCNADFAELYIDGRSVGSANGTYQLQNGKHRIEVSANGYQYYSKTIIVDDKYTRCGIAMIELSDSRLEKSTVNKNTYGSIKKGLWKSIKYLEILGVSYSINSLKTGGVLGGGIGSINQGKLIGWYMDYKSHVLSTDMNSSEGVLALELGGGMLMRLNNCSSYNKFFMQVGIDIGYSGFDSFDSQGLCSVLNTRVEYMHDGSGLGFFTEVFLGKFGALTCYGFNLGLSWTLVRDNWGDLKHF